ncbi:uncharacterized protein RSE6_07594 [Rhynchosporium secalis]|uniref:Aminoglycoside phosphotransferase domain-containing protein n=1 Tax=Rhynchosporium secalis TaxID=38038 RepID=A0A1E1MDC9_RHYSE|nr:uncharacterized protein RSE6_07594 [Rhynchosporium secalis]
MDQVSIHLHLAKYDKFHIPSIVAWDATSNNAVKSEYVVQTKLQGASLHDVYYQLPLTERLEVATSVAEMLLSLESITFENPGRLTGTEEVPITSYRAPTSINAIQITGYRNNPVTNGPLMEKQPLPQFISALVEHRKERHSDWGVLGMKCDQLKEITVEMQRAGMFRIADNHKSFVESAREESVKACHHTVELRFLERGHQVSNHTIELDLAGQLDMEDCHEFDFDIGSLSGTTCHHKVRFPGGKGRLEGLPSRLQDKTSLSVPVEGTNNGKTAGEWPVSGVLDWDDALAVPLVLYRVPPSWLWLSEDERPPLLTHDRDVKPWRDLTGDELLIKAHFDQLMARADSTYLEDAYGRGRWLRALARFGVYPFEDFWELDRYEPFVEAWNAYYASLWKED